MVYDDLPDSIKLKCTDAEVIEKTDLKFRFKIRFKLKFKIAFYKIMMLVASSCI